MHEKIASKSQILASDNWIGFAITVAIIGLWVASLVLLLPLPLSEISLFWIFLAVVGRIFLHTGLFAIAHDAMHASLIPYNLAINEAIGRLAIWLYAFFPYKECRIKHWKHHRYPARIGDPDFHDGVNPNPIFWYFNFMREYLPPRQLALLARNWGIIFGLLSFFGDITLESCLIFWILPLFLSSIQLFVFGTYLPHRGNYDRSTNLHRARSSYYSALWSFLTCYHFGYHWEHHEYPRTPWYRLPAVIKE